MTPPTTSEIQLASYITESDIYRLDSDDVDQIDTLTQGGIQSMTYVTESDVYRLDDDDVRLMDTVDSIGKKQEINFVTESGMYDVVLRSDSIGCRIHN